MNVGRALVTAPGPFRGLRLKILSHGERFYERFGVIAVLFTPTWVAGVAKMRWSRFLLANLLSAMVWALTIGLGAYIIGPAIEDVVTNFALGGTIALGALIAVTAVVGARRRRRRVRDPVP